MTYEAIGPGVPGPRHYLITKGPYRDTSGTIIGIVGVARDLTDMKRLEAEYRQAQKMEAVGRLAGGIAHDFNNLLTVILGYLEDLAAPAEAPGQQALGEVKAAAERAARLTSQLLAFSRRQVLQAQPTDVNALLTNLEHMLGRILGEQIELQTVLPPDAGAALVDPSQFEQVVINLAVNARDAMPNGGRLTITTRACEIPSGGDHQHTSLPPGPYVMVSVADTGEGMDPDVLSRIFEPFFTTKGKTGTGLGLSTVFGIVKQSAGDVSVESTPGVGTTFRFLLPRVAAGGHAGAAASAEPERTPVAGVILLVEDEERLRALLKTVLERQGYTLHICGDVPEAADWLARYDGPLDLVLTDMVMPHGSGLDIERIARATRPDLRLLFMSGYTEHAITDIGQLPAGTHFIQKPFTPKALAQKVRDVLQR